MLNFHEMARKIYGADKNDETEGYKMRLPYGTAVDPRRNNESTEPGFQLALPEPYREPDSGVNFDGPPSMFPGNGTTNPAARPGGLEFLPDPDWEQVKNGVIQSAAGIGEIIAGAVMEASPTGVSQILAFPVITMGASNLGFGVPKTIGGVLHMMTPDGVKSVVINETTQPGPIRDALQAANAAVDLAAGMALNRAAGSASKLSDVTSGLDAANTIAESADKISDAVGDVQKQ